MPPQVVTVRNAGKVAAALQNEKCQRILEHLGKAKDATESEIAQALTIPLSTVHYNMKVLADAHLVLDDVYSYSTRGKQVTHYRMNKNPIVIIQEEAQLEGLKALVPAAVLAAGVGITYHTLTQTNFVDTIAMQAPTADATGIMATGMVEETTLLAMDAAPVAAKMAAPAIEPVAQTAFLPAFIMGVVTVLLLGFLATLALRWWNRRQA